MKKLIKELRSIFENNKIYSKLEDHNKNMLNANFWQDKQKSKIILKEKKLYEDLINSLNSSIDELTNLNDLHKLAEEEANIDVQNEVFKNIKNLKNIVKKNEIKCFLSNEADSLDCYIEIHAGAGGTESQDWATC